MSATTPIEWTDATWNPVRARNKTNGKIGWHCVHVSEGCRNCYAEAINLRLGTGLPFKPGHEKDIEIFLQESILLAPLKWRKPRRIFLSSMTDAAADFVTDDMLDKMFAVMALCRQHTFQILCKRPERMRAYMADVEREAKWMNAVANVFEIDHKLLDRCYPVIGQREPWLPLPNVWLGVSAEDQQRFDERRHDLEATPAAVRFFSFEPLLGAINAREALYSGKFHWVIVGGESGPNARPMHPDWARNLRNDCVVTGVPFFFKQWGEWESALDRDRDDPDGRANYSNDYVDHGKSKWLNLAGGRGFHGDRFHVMRRVGKKEAGNFLDGRQHLEFPR